MLGNFGQLASLLKNAGQMKQNLEEMNQRLEAARFVGEAGGGQVSATVNGRGEPLNIKIEPTLVKGGDVELLEDLVAAAVRDAISRSRESMAKEMQAITGGLSNLPGLGNLFGGTP